MLLTINFAYVNQSTLLPEPVIAALSQELSGETAKSNLELIARYHRMRGSRGFRSAAGYIVSQLRDYGIADARIEQFPADGIANIEKLVAEIKSSAPPEGDGRLVFRRNLTIKGPMSACGYDYFTDHYGAERDRTIRVLQFQGLRGANSDCAYEILNLANGRRTTKGIRDAVSAMYGPIPLEIVVEYCALLNPSMLSKH